MIRVPTQYGENVQSTAEDNVPRRIGSWQFGQLEPNSFFDLAEKRYLLDQALDHELDALIDTLKHNLHIIGYPIDEALSAENGTDIENVTHESLFK